MSTAWVEPDVGELELVEVPEPFAKINGTPTPAVQEDVADGDGGKLTGDATEIAKCAVDSNSVDPIATAGEQESTAVADVAALSPAKAADGEVEGDRKTEENGEANGDSEMRPTSGGLVPDTASADASDEVKQASPVLVKKKEPQLVTHYLVKWRSLPYEGRR